MAVRLHRCANVWVKLPAHPCWRVQKALDEAGIEYELVKGQRKFPAIEFEDGSAYREESAAMAATISAGRLDEKRGGAAPA